jgi:outer membrane murein-binding lipoprotein Lpp
MTASDWLILVLVLAAVITSFAFGLIVGRDQAEIDHLTSQMSELAERLENLKKGPSEPKKKIQ